MIQVSVNACSILSMNRIIRQQLRCLLHGTGLWDADGLAYNTQGIAVKHFKFSEVSVQYSNAVSPFYHWGKKLTELSKSDKYFMSD